MVAEVAEISPLLRPVGVGHCALTRAEPTKLNIAKRSKAFSNKLFTVVKSLKVEFSFFIFMLVLIKNFVYFLRGFLIRVDGSHAGEPLIAFTEFTNCNLLFDLAYENKGYSKKAQKMESLQSWLDF